MKKLIALLLALIMVLGLAACGNTEAPADEPADEPAVDTPAVEEPAEEPADEPAEEPAEEREHVTLRFVSRATEQPDEATVFAAFNEYCEEKLNTTVEWQFLGGTFEDKVSVMINSGEEYDAVWTSSWSNDYATNVARGAYVDITDMLNDYPELVASMPQGFWDATRVDGRIYAVPCQQIAARTPAMSTVAEYAEAFGLDHESQAELKTYGDFEEYLQFCKDNYGAMASPLEEGALGEYLGYELLAGQAACAAVKYGDESCTVVNLYETPEFKEFCLEIADLFQKGLVDPTGYNDVDYKRAEMISGRCSLMVGGCYKPGGEVEDSNSYGIQLWQTPHSNSMMTTSAIIATMWAVSTTSQHPDRALEVLSMLSTDAYAMQLISWGIEGTHYTVTDGIMEIADDAGYNPSTSWSLGNVFLTLPMVGQPADVWTETARVNAEADVSYLIGFTADITNVEAEVTNCTTAFEEYKILLSGSVDVESNLAAMNEKLELAGVDTICAELQTQVDAFLGK